MSYEKRNLYTSLVLGRCEKDTETSHGTCCQLGHRKRNATQRTEKAKKETRRQRVVQAVEQVGPFQLFVFFVSGGFVIGRFRWRHGLKSLQTLQMPNKVMPNRRCDDNDDPILLGLLMSRELYFIYNVPGFWLAALLLLGWKNRFPLSTTFFHHQGLKMGMTGFFKTNYHYFLIPCSHAGTEKGAILLFIQFAQYEVEALGDEQKALEEEERLNTLSFFLWSSNRIVYGF